MCYNIGMDLETIIGLEVHLELKTQSKMFCACSNELSRGGEPNTQVCPICLGTPGTLPVVNDMAVKQALKLAVALKCEIHKSSVFARKHYYYPDLPKGYQITQYDQPLATGGIMILDNGDEVAIERLHLEEDTAKMIHQKNGATLINHNRAGVPLLELVTKPVIKSPESARLFAQQLQKLVQALGVSDAEMQSGHLRVDANISLRPAVGEARQGRPAGDEKMYPKTEIKNLNSTKSVQQSLEYEIKRQSALWEKNDAPQTMSTRGWDETKNETVLQRDKEEAKDYRYFPEPDLLPLVLAEADIHEAEKYVSEALGARESAASGRQEFKTQYNLSDKDLAKIPPSLEKLFTQAVEMMLARMDGQGEMSAGEDQKIALARKWLGIIDKIRALKGEVEPAFFEARISYLADLLEKLLKKEITSNQLQDAVSTIALAGDKDLSALMEKLTFENKTLDYDVLAQEVIGQYPELVVEYKKGKVAVLKFLLGSVIKITKGAADPAQAEAAIKKLLA